MEELTNYNIYAGKKGEIKYLYTTLCRNLLEADMIAKQELELEYELYNDTRTYEDALEEAVCRLKRSKIPYTSQDLHNRASNIYEIWRYAWGSFYAISMAEDTIPKEDLIFDYVLDSQS